MNIRQIALETPLQKQTFWVERWQTWVLVQELSGAERAELLDQCTNIIKQNGKREAKVNLKKLYPMLAVLSIRNPDPLVLPSKDDPNYAKYPGALDDSGNYFTPPCDDPGELVFSLDDLAILNKGSGAILEDVSKPAAIMSGLREEDIEEKKGLLEAPKNTQDDTVESTGYTIE